MTAAAPVGGAEVVAFEAEARRWCRERGLDPDGEAPGIMVGPLGFASEKYWVRRARQMSIAEADRAQPRRARHPPARAR